MRAGIRVRITASALAAVVAVLVATSVALLYSQQRLLTDNIDEILQTYSDRVEADPAANPLPGQGDEDSIAQVVAADGTALAATANYRDQPPLPAPTAATRRWTSDLPIDEGNYRILSRRVDGVVIHTATPFDDVEESVAALRTGLAVAIPAVAALLGGLIWWLVGRTLRPVESIRAQVADIGGANLHFRVLEPATDDEISRLARTMNAMLDRVETAAERQRRFVADASHELRSPLTRMRTELEVDLDHPDTADLPATHRSVLDEVTNLQRLVEDLLELARNGTAGNRSGWRPVDLDDLVFAEAAAARPGAAARIDASGVSAAQVRGDPDQLARVIRNLVDNAVRYAASTVRLRVTEADGWARVSVGDDGPGIPDHERSRVFERFARLDEARHDDTGGTGLGLAIAREIVERHGGTIRIDTPVGGHGTEMVVALPIDADPGPLPRTT